MCVLNENQRKKKNILIKNQLQTHISMILMCYSITLSRRWRSRQLSMLSIIIIIIITTKAVRDKLRQSRDSRYYSWGSADTAVDVLLTQELLVLCFILNETFLTIPWTRTRGSTYEYPWKMTLCAATVSTKLAGNLSSIQQPGLCLRSTSLIRVWALVSGFSPDLCRQNWNNLGRRRILNKGKVSKQ